MLKEDTEKANAEAQAEASVAAQHEAPTVAAASAPEEASAGFFWLLPQWMPHAGWQHWLLPAPLHLSFMSICGQYLTCPKCITILASEHIPEQMHHTVDPLPCAVE